MQASDIDKLKRNETFDKYFYQDNITDYYFTYKNGENIRKRLVVLALNKSNQMITASFYLEQDVPNYNNDSGAGMIFLWIFVALISLFCCSLLISLLCSMCVAVSPTYYPSYPYIWGIPYSIYPYWFGPSYYIGTPYYGGTYGGTIPSRTDGFNSYSGSIGSVGVTPTVATGGGFSSFSGSV